MNIHEVKASDLWVGDEIVNAYNPYRGYGWTIEHVVKNDDVVNATGRDRHGVQFALSRKPHQTVRLIVGG